MPAPATYRKQAFAATPIHLDVEMETGTGKTYCYIKSMFEMNERYGWSKFIIMVPSIAIREGVYKSLQIIAEHLLVAKRTSALDRQLRVTPLQYIVQKGQQKDGLADQQLRQGDGFKISETAT